MTPHRKTALNLAFIVSAAAPLTLFSTNVTAALNYTKVVATYDPVPGAPAGVLFDKFDLPVIADDGKLAFLGTVQGAGVTSTNTTGIWTTGFSGLDLVARQGDAAVGTDPGVTYESFGTPVVNRFGRTSFLAGLTGTGVDSSNDIGIWTEVTGGLVKSVREGDFAAWGEPNISHDNLRYISNPQISDTGHIVFSSTVSGAGVGELNNTGSWRAGQNSHWLLYREGDQAPGTDPGVNFLFPGNLVLNDVNKIAFHSALIGPGVTADNRDGIWSDVSGVLDLIVREGDAAPGTETDVIFDNVTWPMLSDGGHVAFRASLSGPGIDFFNNNGDGIWMDSGNGVELIARSSDPAVGTAPGIELGFPSFPSVNSSGHVAFVSELDGPGVLLSTDDAFWVHKEGGLTLVAREGDQAPGGDPDLFIDSISNPLISETGQVAFRGFVSGPGVDTTNDRAVWMTNPAGELVQVVRKGDVIDLNDDPLLYDFRTIENCNPSQQSPQDGMTSNDGEGWPVKWARMDWCRKSKAD